MISEAEMLGLFVAAKEIFMSQAMVLALNAPSCVCSDIHDQLRDLIRLFNINGWPPSVNYHFLGDYIDRGKWGLEMFLFLLALNYPGNFLLLRGKHEIGLVNRIYGF